MNKKWVRDNLEVIDDWEGTKIKLNEDGTLGIFIDVFLRMFGESEPTYQGLSDNPNTTPSWQDIFDKWKEQGILN